MRTTTPHSQSAQKPYVIGGRQLRLFPDANLTVLGTVDVCGTIDGAGEDFIANTPLMARRSSSVPHLSLQHQVIEAI